MIPKKTVRNLLTSNGQTKYLYIIATTTTALILYLTTGINCCVVIPREFLATVGEVVSLGCNARPNNEQRGSVSNVKLENEDKSETLIFQVPVYNSMGKISTEQFVANGYFLSKLDENLINATIQINETQLKHGGRYVCSCTAATISTGSGNLVVLADKLSFLPNGGNPPTPGEPLDLNCSLSFSGSISSVSVDLTINDANGTQLAAKGNLSLTSSSQGIHYVNYSFIAHRNKEQNFTCEMRAWNRSSSEKRLLRSMTSDYSLNSDSRADVAQAAVGSVVGVVLSIFLVLIVSIVIVIFVCRKRATVSVTGACKNNSCNIVAQKNSTTTIPSRYEDRRPSIEHLTEDREQRNETLADKEVIVFDNVIYDASPTRAVSTDGCNAEQVYNEIC